MYTLITCSNYVSAVFENIFNSPCEDFPKRLSFAFLKAFNVKTKILKCFVQNNQRIGLWFPYLLICCLKLKTELFQLSLTEFQKERLILNISFPKKTRGLFNSFQNFMVEYWPCFLHFSTFCVKHKIKYTSTFSYSHHVDAGTHADHPAEKNHI